MEKWLAVLVIVSALVVISECRKRPNGKPRLRNRDLLNDAADGTCELELSCKDADSVPIKLPIKGPMGPPGPEGKTGEAGISGTPGIPGIPGKTSETTRVAFLVGLDKNVGAVKDNTDLAFSSVVTNVGSAYNAETGRFSAPVNGTYHFTVVVSAQGGRRAAASLVKNGAMIVTIWAESLPWGSASNSAILELKSRDQVWLVQLKRAPYLHGYMYSTFSGMILWEDDHKSGENDT